MVNKCRQGTLLTSRPCWKRYVLKKPLLPPCFVDVTGSQVGDAWVAESAFGKVSLCLDAGPARIVVVQPGLAQLN